MKHPWLPTGVSCDFSASDAIVGFQRTAPKPVPTRDERIEAIAKRLRRGAKHLIALERPDDLGFHQIVAAALLRAGLRDVMWTSAIARGARAAEHNLAGFWPDGPPKVLGLHQAVLTRTPQGGLALRPFPEGGFAEILVVFDGSMLDQKASDALMSWPTRVLICGDESRLMPL